MFGKKLVTVVFSFFVFIGVSQAQTEGEKGVKILSKPRVSYTDEARKNNVSGWVQVKVTFQADGKIGEVIYFKESSEKKELTRDGLVRNTVEAAKKIKFEPATKNGQPVTVTKILSYSFNIY